jgi:hypothetical protein
MLDTVLKLLFNLNTSIYSMRSLFIIICLFFSTVLYAGELGMGIGATKAELKKECKHANPATTFKWLIFKKYNTLCSENSEYSGMYYFLKQKDLCYAVIMVPKTESFDAGMLGVLNDRENFVKEGDHWMLLPDKNVKAEHKYSNETKSMIFAFSFVAPK